MGFIRAANSIFWGWTIIILLIATGLLFTIGLKFPQVRNFKDMIRALFKDGRKSREGVNSFAALCSAVGGQVGTGNMAGVATAIASGGPGAVFWMWIIGIVGMATSFAEAVLAQVFREKNEDGTYVGGPTYYFSKGIGGKLGKAFAVFFTIVTIINTGFIIASLQINSIANGFDGLINIPKWVIGVVSALITGLVIFGGIRRISDVAKYLVPIMALLYLAVALICVIVNIKVLPDVIVMVVKSAFGAQAVAGGALGFTMKQAFRYGCARGLFSNEAGQGTSPAMHGSADVDHPAAQGYVAMFGVLADTLVICTSTAFIILCTGAYQDTSLTGINLTQAAIGSVIGSAGPYFILFCICMFAWTSCLADIYYGEACIHWISKDNKTLLTVYRLICVLLLIGGAVINADIMWELADFANALMIFPNAIALIILSPLVFKVAKDYERQKKDGNSIPKWNYEQSVEELKGKK